MTEETPTLATLELTAPRVLQIRFGTFPYKWTFRRILIEDWLNFFRAFETETVQLLGEQIETFEIETALVELARETVVSVEGYSSQAPANFRTMLPRGHLKAFGMALRDVCVSREGDDAPIDLTDLHEVKIDCTWSAPPEGGGVVQFTGLVHRFRSPTMKQQRDYNRATNTYRIKGDSRAGRTIYPARQALMIGFYDALIESVDTRYTVNGEPLIGAKSIAREMDGCHKVAAVMGFLNAGGAGTVESAKVDGGEETIQ
jgi:hypothetical protein